MGGEGDPNVPLMTNSEVKALAVLLQTLPEPTQSGHPCPHPQPRQGLIATEDDLELQILLHYFRALGLCCATMAGLCVAGEQT